MQVTYDALMKDLSRGNFAPVYFLEGEEAFYIDNAADYLEEHVLEPAQKDFNMTILYGRDTQMVDVLNAARRYTMFSDKQLIMVREAAPLFQNMSDKDKQLLSGYLEQPMPDSILVFCHKYKNLDKRLAIGKLVRDKTVYLDAQKLKDYQLPEWISAYVLENGFGIEHKTALLLAEYLGNDLSRISNEIGKLHILLPPGSTISPEVVEEHIGISKEFNTFELKDALLGKNFHKCVRILNYFDHNPGAGPVNLVMGTLYAEFSKLYVLHQVPAMSDNEYAAKLGTSPMGAKSLKNAAKNYSLKKTEQILSLLSIYDVRTKGINNKNADANALLNELVYRIIFE